VEAEATGALDNALALYRRAFKIDSTVDRVYERSLQRDQHHSPTTLTLPALLQDFSISERTPAASRASAAIPTRFIIAGFISEPIAFQAEDETAPVPIQTLPPEIIVYILRLFGRLCDYTSIEAFARVSRKARLISLEPSVWR
jgi:F-box protein 9